MALAGPLPPMYELQDMNEDIALSPKVLLEAFMLAKGDKKASRDSCSLGGGVGLPLAFAGKNDRSVRMRGGAKATKHFGANLARGLESGAFLILVGTHSGGGGLVRGWRVKPLPLPSLQTHVTELRSLHGNKLSVQDRANQVATEVHMTHKGHSVLPLKVVMPKNPITSPVLPGQLKREVGGVPGV